MNENHKLAIAVIVILVATVLAFVMGMFWYLLHQQPVTTTITNVWYNNTTTIQYQCCELERNCSAISEPIENITYVESVGGYTTELSYYNIDEPTPTQTPLATPEFPFLPTH